MNIPINATDFMQRPFWYAFQPYVSLLGFDFVFGAIIGFIVAGVYVGTDRNTYVTAITLILMASFMGVILHSAFQSMIILISAAIIAVLVYKKLVVPREEYR